MQIQSSQTTPNPSIVREKWEQNLISASIKVLRDDATNKNTLIQSAHLDNNHVVFFFSVIETLQIINAQMEIIYKTLKGQKAMINLMTEEQKSYWESITDGGESGASSNRQDYTKTGILYAKRLS